jgi:hypothetical protein
VVSLHNLFPVDRSIMMDPRTTSPLGSKSILQQPAPRSGRTGSISELISSALKCGLQYD